MLVEGSVMQVESGPVVHTEFLPGETGQDTQSPPNVYIALSSTALSDLGLTPSATKTYFARLGDGGLTALEGGQGLIRVAYKAVPV